MADGFNNSKSSGSSVGAGIALAALPALGGVASTLLSNSANADAARYATDYDYKKWREYVQEIDPKTQVAKLRAAGINPAIAMGNGAIDSGNPSSPQNAANVPPYDFSPIAQGVNSSVELYQQRRLQDAQISQMDAVTQNQQIRNKTQLIRDIAEFTKMANDANKSDSEREHYKWLAEVARKEYESFDARNKADIDLKTAEKNQAQAHADYLVSQKEYQDILIRFAPKQQVMITRNLEATNGELMSAIRKNDSETAKNVALKALTKAQKEGVDIDNSTKDSMADVIVDKAYNEADESYWKAQQAGKRYRYGTVGEQAPNEPFDMSGYRPSTTYRGRKRK